MLPDTINRSDKVADRRSLSQKGQVSAWKLHLPGSAGIEHTEPGSWIVGSMGAEVGLRVTSTNGGERHGHQ